MGGMPQHNAGMRPQGHRNGRCTMLGCVVTHLLQEVLMAHVQPVKESQRGNGPRRMGLGERVPDLHGIVSIC